jgi:integrase
MTRLQSALDDYLQLRRALGHKLDDTGRQLARFVDYLDDMGEETVTIRSALAFVLDPKLDPASSVPAHRLTAVRGFARHLAGTDARTEIPPAGVVRYRPRRRTPYLFSDDDVTAVVHCARASTPSRFRAETLTTLIGLLAATGMRVGEAIRLDRDEVDWDDAVLLVRDTKFHKGRNVPVSDSTINALGDYARIRDRRPLSTSRFFTSLCGTPIHYNNFSFTFRNAVMAAGIGSSLQVQPHIHDLRHSFAVRTLVGWYRAGLDVDVLLPRLSTYLGHREPRFTYTYLTATPELLGHAAARLEAAYKTVPR